MQPSLQNGKWRIHEKETTESAVLTSILSPSLTPVQTILKAYDTFLEDSTGMAGELLECSAEKLIYYPMPKPGNGHITQRATTVWEPLFRMMHGEDSKLSEAIP